ncbi:sulfurtransferase [Undibacterium sp.]|uniref:sulfurtransferase n=1 Tax=Undibacterium sp. TaxID=1914977 RepID=UPI002B567126|nr:sulfurtransferase [Undibacterium sp.]HTD06591.1 sulfurtransferase [Undibacterium sp.]
MAAAICVLLAVPAPRASEHSAIVDTGQVVEAMQRHAIIWDTRSAADYKLGHIPDAVNIDDIGVVLRDENTEDYIALEKIERLLSAAGIDPSKEIIVYGDKASPYVYFGLVTLQYLNAANARIYHGGIDDWRAAGRPVSNAASQLPPVALKLTTNPALLVDTAEVVKKLHDPRVQIVDARTPKEYRGEDIRAIRGGHIPGAIPVHYMENWVDPETPGKLEKKLASNKDGMNLKSREQLQSLYSKLDPDKETIVYCQSGIRASETATILKDLGFKDVKVYDSSWLGYGNTLDAPAENVTFFNLGLLQGKLNAMQKRIDKLEKEVAKENAAK